MWSDLGASALTHVLISILALAAALLCGLPLGAWAAASPSARGAVLGAAAVGRTLPSIALLALLVPLVGVGVVPAVAALVLLALPPVVIATEVAVRGVPAAALDAATGMGMGAPQRWLRVIVPYAGPVALSGVRIAFTEVIASATLATFIGAGGLGDEIVRGMQTGDATLLLASAGCVAALAFAADIVLARASRALEIR